MQKLFNLLPSAGQGVVRFPDWLYVRTGLRRNLETVLRFAHNHPMAVPSDHFLVTLLHTLNIPLSHNLYRYFENVDAVALNRAMALKMTSSIYKGKVFYGTFYGQGTDEVLVAHTDNFDVDLVDQNWRRAQPVTVLRHPMSDLKLGIPDGKAHNSEYGLAVIAVNIPMLAVMYRAFRREEHQVANGESERSVMHFVRMFVLPNMLASHLDIALFNRFNRLRTGAPVGESHFKHSFAMPDLTERVDNSLGKVVDYLQDARKNFTGILKTIPAAVHTDMLEALVEPDMAPTYQVIWALLIARLPIFQMLVEVAKRGGTETNMQELNTLRAFVRANKVGHVWQQMLPIEVRWDVEEEIASIVGGPLGIAA